MNALIDWKGVGFMIWNCARYFVSISGGANGRAYAPATTRSWTTVLFWCWATSYNAGPRWNQQWVNFLFLLGSEYQSAPRPGTSGKSAAAVATSPGLQTGTFIFDVQSIVRAPDIRGTTLRMAILWNAVTSLETVLKRNSVKTNLYNTPPPYFIVLTSSVKILEGKAIEFHIMITESVSHAKFLITD